jgi:dephospho-CoA kinase
MAAYAIKIEPRIQKALSYHPGVVILDGLYSWEEYLYLKPKFPQLKLLAVYTQPELRLKRLSKRSIRPLNSLETQVRDQAEIENLHKAGPIALADYLVLNNGSVNDLHSQLEIFLHSLSL